MRRSEGRGGEGIHFVVCRQYDVSGGKLKGNEKFNGKAGGIFGREKTGIE